MPKIKKYILRPEKKSTVVEFLPYMPLIWVQPLASHLVTFKPAKNDP